ncbi:ABC transporter permease [Mesorhizobium sp. B2-3-3]|uniref:ABC transporter permease n=1 Tax=Mesorhizobium sp. B2-3-5 TaxID=2589958 RepID=UPI001127C7C1|nr:ABC transporter permease [Mesorhizobium sp. B2-3-5]TPM19198.1 ABC transporter permease [Mesorhizobium sp. B2-3-5]TPN37829.1 ABC transporter permease [Mesorhizobium sp. B2-3-3]
MFEGFPRPRWQSVSVRIFAVLIAIFLAAPSFIVIPMSLSGSNLLEFPPSSFSLRWYDNYLGSTKWQAATWASAKLGLLTVLVAVPIGFAAAYGARSLSVKMRTALAAIVLLPALVPTILVGIGLYFLLAKVGLVGTVPGVLLGHVALSLPVIFLIMTAGFNQFDPVLEQASYSLGASRFTTIRLVVLPQLAYSIVVSALLAFLTSLDEVVVALLISSGFNSTLPKVMFTALKNEIDPTIAVVSTLLLVIASLATVFVLLRGKVYGAD